MSWLPRCLQLGAASALFAAACSPAASSNTLATTAVPTVTPVSTMTATPAPSPAPTYATSSVATQPTATPVPAEQPVGLETARDCVSAVTTTLQNVTGTPAGPYLIRHPPVQVPTGGPTVIFIPGGSGKLRNAQRVWDNYVSNGRTVDAFRFVIPYTLDESLLDETTRIRKVLDEVLACYGGDPSQVHIAGFSNGGLAAFSLMLRYPARFATLLGAPGAFPSSDYDPTSWGAILEGKAVFNGVGENDEGWRDDVKATNEALVGAGIDSVYVEFAGQGHGVTADFDENVFFDFWAAHSTLPPPESCY